VEIREKECRVDQRGAEKRRGVTGEGMGEEERTGQWGTTEESGAGGSIEEAEVRV
jgi:hypothetical protein